MNNNFFDLSGEVAIVTGGNGQLGSQYVTTLTNAGATVRILDVRGDNPVDITNKEQVIKAFDTIEKEVGTPTILINNAGIDAPPNAPASNTGPFEDYPESIWDAVVDSHLKGALFVSQEFIKRIRPTGKKGSIINISSTYGVVTPDQSLYDFKRERGEVFFKPIAYSVAKSGMLNFTRWVAEYCGNAHIPVRVNTLVPGGVFNNQDDVFVKEYAKRTIIGRMAQADEYNGAILFLASHKASSYMTGSTLIIDGGWTAK